MKTASINKTIDGVLFAVYHSNTQGRGWYEETTRRQALINTLAGEILKAYETRTNERR